MELGLLAQRPDIQDKAAKAIQEMYGQDEPMCSVEDDQKCAYVAALVRECLRYVSRFKNLEPMIGTLTGIYLLDTSLFCD